MTIKPQLVLTEKLPDFAMDKKVRQRLAWYRSNTMQRADGTASEEAYSISAILDDVLPQIPKNAPPDKDNKTNAAEVAATAPNGHVQATSAAAAHR